MTTYDLSALKNLDFGILNISSKIKHCPPNYRLVENRGRPHHGFLYVIDGEAEYICGNSEGVVVRKNDIVYLPKNIKYESQASSTNCHSYILVNMDIIDGSKADIAFNNKISVVLNASTTYYYKIFTEINNSYTAAGMASSIKCKSFSYEMLYNLALDLFKNELASNNYIKVYPGILYIEENYHKDIKINDLANASHLSISHFRKLFGGLFGMSPVEYVNNLRIKKACELLKSGMYTVSEAAEKTGFTNVYYFSRLFKSITGVSPKKMIE